MSNESINQYGITSGTYAAAATKAAVYFLLTGIPKEYVYITLPNNETTIISIFSSITKNSQVTCFVKNDCSDDTDITNGLLITSKVQRISNGISIDGGEGIGRITKQTIDQKLGEASIFPGPRKQITQAATEVANECLYSGGFAITISVPSGKEIAMKNLKPQLGVEGGLSILGTSIKTKPINSEAITKTIRAEICILSIEGKKSLIITPSNYGSDFLEENEEYEKYFSKAIKCNNHIGETLEAALEYGFKDLLIIGNLGKLIKLGVGIMNTHSSYADGRMEVLITCGLLAGINNDKLKLISKCATVDAALDIIGDRALINKVVEILLKKITFHLNKKVNNEINTAVILFSNKYGFLGKTKNTIEIEERILDQF